MDNIKMTKDAEAKLVEAMELYKQQILLEVRHSNKDKNVSLKDIEIAIRKINQQKKSINSLFKRNTNKEFLLWFFVCVCLLIVSFGGILTTLGDTDKHIDLSKTGEIVMFIGTIINIILFIVIFIVNSNKRQYPSKEIGVLEFMTKWKYFEEKLKQKYKNSNKEKIPSYFDLIAFLIQSNDKNNPEIVTDFKNVLHFRNDLVHRSRIESISMNQIKEAHKKLDKLIKCIEF